MFIGGERGWEEKERKRTIVNTIYIFHDGSRTSFFIIFSVVKMAVNGCFRGGAMKERGP